MQSIPPLSPDLNPIENIFHTVRRQLKEDALAKEITKETYGQFCSRVKTTIENLSVDLINKTIASLPDRLNAVIKSKGARTKY